MSRYFNITGCCNPQEHYMVNLDSRLAQIKEMVDKGQYFSINKGRQYGKTTILKALREYLKGEYVVISMDFQFVSTSEFATENSFVKAFARLLWNRYRREMPSEIEEQIKRMKLSLDYVEADLFAVLSEWCEMSSKPIVLMIDEVDSASNNQVFLDFLAQLRGYYLERTEYPTFRSVILAGLLDRYFFTISATLKTIASSNSRRSRPVSFLIFSRRYTSVLRWTNRPRLVSETFRLFSKKRWMVNSVS